MYIKEEKGMSGRRPYATKTTVNVNVNDEDFRRNVEFANQLASKLNFLYDLQSTYEKCIDVLPPFSPKTKRRKISTDPFDFDLDSTGDIDFSRFNNSGDDGDNEHLHSPSHGDYNNDTTTDHQDQSESETDTNFGEGSSTNPFPHHPNGNGNVKIRKPRKAKDPTHTTTATTTNTYDNDDHEFNSTNGNGHTTTTVRPKRSLLKKGRKVKRRPGILDTSLLRPVSTFPELNLDPEKERTAHSLGHLTTFANYWRLKSNQLPMSLPLSSKAESTELLKQYAPSISCLQNTQSSITDNMNLKIMDHVHRRPFLSEKSITNYQLQKSIIAAKFNLQDGDVIHMPFSKEERNIAEVLRGTAISTEEWATMLSGKLPGRTLADCERYVHAVNSGAGYLIQEAIIYRTTNKIKGGLNNISKIFQQREYSPKYFAHPTTTQNEVRRRQVSMYQQVSLSPICSGATIDVKFDPTGIRDKLLVGCAKNDGATGSNFSMLYDVKIGKSIVLDRHKDTVAESRFSLDGSKLITAGWSKSSINIWDADTGEFLVDLIEAAELGEGWHPNRLALHHYDPSIVAACAKEGDRSVYIWRMGDDLSNIASVNLTSRTELPGYLHEMDFSRGINSHLLVGASDHKEIQKKRNISVMPGWAVVFDIESQTYINHSTPHKTQVSCVRTSPCGTKFVTGAPFGIATTDIRTCNVVHQYYTYQPDITVVTFSPCGKFVTSSGEDNRIYVFDSRFSKLPLHVLSHKDVGTEGEHDGVSATIWSHYGDLLITGGEDNAIRIWDIRLGNPEIHSMYSHNAPVSTLAISRSDQLLASGGLDWQVCLHSQVCTTDDKLNPIYKLSQTLLSEMSNSISVPE